MVQLASSLHESQFGLQSNGDITERAGNFMGTHFRNFAIAATSLALFAGVAPASPQQLRWSGFFSHCAFIRNGRSLAKK